MTRQAVSFCSTPGFALPKLPKRLDPRLEDRSGRTCARASGARAGNRAGAPEALARWSATPHVTGEAKHEPIFTTDEWERLKASFGLRSKYRKLEQDGLFAQGALALTCAANDCGCKITFDPKTKANGVTYLYYRCADGKRVHRDRGEARVHVSEGDILEQMTTAIDAIQITADLAEAIAFELNATHREAMAAKARSAGTYQNVRGEA